MQSFLAKCAAVGIVAGGFTLTGDVGRLAERGRALIDATTVPAERPIPQDAATAPPSRPADEPPAPRVAETAPATPRQAATPPSPAAPADQSGRADKPWRLPGDAPADAPVGNPAALPVPVSGGVDAIELRRLTAGTRLLVWVRKPGTPGRGQSVTDMIALDIIDPAGGEALEHRHAAVSAGGRGPIHAAPRRVIVAADGSGRLTRGDALRVAPLRGVHGTGPHEEIGRVLAIEVKSP